MNANARHSCLVSLAVGAAMLLPVQSGAAVRSAEEETGQLRIDVVGARIPVDVMVTGPEGSVPDGYREVVTADRTLKWLTPGMYRVLPSPQVTPARRPAVTVSNPEVRVRAGRRSQVTVTYAHLQPVRRLAAGEFTTCAALRSGEVRCWGDTMREGRWPLLWPMTVVPGVTDARSVTVSSRSACALRRTGTVKCWGQWYLGDGTRKASVRPVRVRGLDDVVAIEAGELHACALRANGRVRCWGMNAHGQLGTGTQNSAARPKQVSGIHDAVAISAGARHTCALLADGTVRCWGDNERGQLGNGTEHDATVPVKVAKLQGATTIAAGGQHTCAVLRDRTMKCWGLNENGQLGNDYPYMDGDDRWSSYPVKVVLIDMATSVSAGSIHTCARLQGGTMNCWGNNTFGQLGTARFGGNVDRPVRVSRISDATSISGGALYTCTVRSGGAAACWGNNIAGQLGDGSGAYTSVPVPVLNFGR